MNVQDFTYLLQHPNKVVTPVQTHQLKEVLDEYPYFQAARALHLKGLKNLNSFKYNAALKVAAAHTADREVLFDYITSKEFLQNAIADTISGKSTPLNELEILSEEIPMAEQPKMNMIADSEDEPLPQNIKDADAILDPRLFTSKNTDEEEKLIHKTKEKSDSLGLGEPLSFTKKEKHSFGEWLQLASLKTINREDRPIQGNMEPINFPLEEAVLKNKKSELIDKFIASNPKIVPKKDIPKINISESTKIDRKELMTETLARVYLEQKKYKKAIQAYKILSLKYPEKSGFFADRIKAVKKIQQENR
ncbi:hypothetical protein FK220_019200 [Flavobacteriaceae bacterium TP-CH-4]|uniref:Tetratricopeptide repeat protein n=1 Tax=Pelagihabitans pacificus TaxID=2696054 RepID=A0A967EFJ9_9FLAO|nr:hypothetical protein [Pelagihabitans pacificus]NHF61488.1 hypothetical protein [Pelagihabitans pacificus]